MSSLFVIAASVVMLVILQTVNSKFIKFQDCGSPGVTLQSVSIVPCSVEPCEFIRDVNIAINISFVTKQISAPGATLVGYVITSNGQIIQLPIDEPDLCKNLVRGSCPLKTRTSYTLGRNETISASIPPVGVMTFQLQAIGASPISETLFCIQYKARV